MKIFLSYLLVGIYATILIRPVMPTLADLVSHVLNYKEHNATVHKHDGKLHVHNEYIATANKDFNNTGALNHSYKKVDKPNEHIIAFTHDIILSSLSLQIQLNLLLQRLSSISLPDDLRPPIYAYSFQQDSTPDSDYELLHSISWISVYNLTRMQKNDAFSLQWMIFTENN